MKPGVAPRLTAARVVGRVMREGAWTRPALDSGTAGLGLLDRRMVEGIAFGTIRYLGGIDPALAAASRRRLAEIDPRILDLLRVAAFEIWHGHAPTPIAVDTAVEAARETNLRAVGFVNAVLRRLADSSPPSGRADRLALPSWLLDRLDASWGQDETDAFALASLREAPIFVRRRPGAQTPPGMEVAGIAGAYEVPPAGIGSHPVQDPSSVAVGQALDVQSGALVADLAAAPGGKTIQILDALAGKGAVVALDRHPGRVRRARRRAPDARWAIGDGTMPPLRQGRFDRVLVDAPCSGLGTLRRRPEIRHRVTPAEIERLASIQARMIEAGLKLLAPGGRMVYSVCTVTAEETVDQVATLDASPPVGLPGRSWGQGWLLAPHLGPTDGMFVAVIVP